MVKPIEWDRRNSFFAQIYEKLPLRSCSVLRSHRIPCKPETCINSNVYQTLLTNDDKTFSLLLEDYYDHLKKNYLTVDKSFPLVASAMRSVFGAIHFRTIKHPKNTDCYRYACMPGFDKLFCDVNGNYYPCERTERTECFCIGNVDIGLDVPKVLSLLDQLRKMGKCSSCQICSFCEMCFSMIHVDGLGQWDEDFYNNYCQGAENSGLKYIKDYVSLMETNSDIMDLYIDRDLKQDLFQFLKK